MERAVIEERCKELDLIIEEMSKYRNTSLQEIRANLSTRWILERGLIAGASLIFDMADHILAEEFGVYASTYEESISSLYDKGVISPDLYSSIKGLGGLRNILIHRYLSVDLSMVLAGFYKSLSIFPRFAAEVLQWLDEQDICSTR
jgi:uncharacterized protein YutE (UPF0331/DUF86 family)